MVALEKFVQKNQFVSALLSILGINVACNVSSSIIYDWLNTNHFGSHWNTLWQLAQCALCGALLYFSIRSGQYLLKFVVYTRSTTLRTATPRKVVVWFLSRSSPKPMVASNGKVQEAIELPGFPTKDLMADLATLAAGKKSKYIQMWPWEQPLRSIARHLGLDGKSPLELQNQLDVFVLVCSSDTLVASASFVELVMGYSACRDIKILRWLHNKSAPHELVGASHSAYCPQMNGWDFDNFIQMEDCLRALIRQLHHLKYSDR
jgi:hypothetical protein